jgi:two-component system alkaline phosphatase synthesis response regulator PhoP
MSDWRKSDMKSIPVIEDEKDIGDLVGYHLKKCEFQVLRAVDGSSGLERAIKGKPDLIVLDLMLPGWDGKNVSRALKSNSATQTIPLLMPAAKAEELDPGNYRRRLKCLTGKVD